MKVENKEEIENETEGTQSKKLKRIVVSGDESQIQVCQKMFLSTLGYRTDKVLRNLQRSTAECSKT